MNNKYTKYPRTYHLPWSQAVTADDKRLTSTEQFNFRRVVVTEKMDGECFPASTKISKIDGTEISIGTIVRKKMIGLEILGVDDNGNIVPTKVTNVFDNGKNSDLWYKIYYSKDCGGTRTIYTTGNHVFFKADGTEVAASELRVGDTLSQIGYCNMVPTINTARISKILRTEHHNKTVNGKYDIETETHNYFAASLLVHNCTSLYSDHYHARSLDSRNHPSRNWVKNFWASIRHNIPTGMRVCGENLYAEHSIAYTGLETYFHGFSMWDGDTCLCWDETLEWFDLIGIKPVREIYRGYYDEQMLRDMELDTGSTEGYVVRVEDSFDIKEFNSVVGKFVRADHVQTDEHWSVGEIVPNQL